MNPVQHPEDERLSALAAGDDDARTERALTAHVDGCARCHAVVDELTSLRSHLAALPDRAPERPIRIILPPRGAPAGGFASLVRRLFAPALAAGATMAIVGAVGMSSIGFGGAATVPATTEFDAGAPAAASAPALDSGVQVAEASDGQERAAMSSGETMALDGGGDAQALRESEPFTPWLPLLVAGIALAGIVLLLRFALVPRAG